MRKKLFAVLLCVAAIGTKAQEFTTTDFITSEEGFEVKSYQWTLVNKQYPGGVVGCNDGLYSKDGKIFVCPIGNVSNGTFVVLSGTEYISSHAFSNFYGVDVYLPSSVKYIAPDALTSYYNQTGTSSVHPNLFMGITDAAQEDVGAATRTKDNPLNDAVVEGRYNLNGQQVAVPTQGVNIIRYSDNSSRKVVGASELRR